MGPDPEKSTRSDHHHSHSWKEDTERMGRRGRGQNPKPRNQLHILAFLVPEQQEGRRLKMGKTEEDTYLPTPSALGLHET